MCQLLSFGLLVIVGMTYAQQQPKCSFDDLKTCLKQGLNNSQSHLSTPQPSAQQQKYAACFTNNGCDVPSPKNQTGAAKSSAVWQCRQKVEDGVKSDIEKCVQSSYPDFKFPQHSNGSNQQHHRQNVGKKLDQLCHQNQKAKNATEACLKQLHPQQQNDWKQREAAVCSKLDDCFKKQPAGCKDKFVAIKQKLCDCAQNVSKAQGDKLNSELAKCGNNNNNNGGNQAKGQNSQTLLPAALIAQRFCKKNECDGKH